MLFLTFLFLGLGWLLFYFLVIIESVFEYVSIYIFVFLVLEFDFVLDVNNFLFDFIIIFFNLQCLLKYLECFLIVGLCSECLCLSEKSLDVVRLVLQHHVCIANGLLIVFRFEIDKGTVRQTSHSQLSSLFTIFHVHF